MPERSMTTRRSARNLQQLELQKNDSSDEETCRDYDLNYDKAIKKKVKACNVEYSVRGRLRGEIMSSVSPLPCTNFIARSFWNI